MGQLILGVDPGFAGALALYEPSTNSVVDILDMPIFLDKKKKKHVNALVLNDWLRSQAHGIKRAVIEEVGAMPGNGTSSMFRFGYYAGMVNGLVFANGIQTFFVKPAVWKTIMGISNDKADSFKRADELMPFDRERWKLKKHDGRAEAALLARFGANNFGKQ